MWKMGGGINSVRSEIYSIVQKRHKESPDQVNGDYSGTCSSTFYSPFLSQENILEGSIKQVLFCNFTLLKCAKLEQAMNVIAGDCSL